MARIPTPTAQQDAKGYFEKHPDRKRKGELRPEGSLPKSAPKNFNADQKRMWKWFVKTCPPGVATSWDLPLVCSLVKLLAKEMYGELIGEARFPISIQERAQMISLAARFGMSPADRAKIAIEAPKQSKLQAFVSRKRPADNQPVVQ